MDDKTPIEKMASFFDKRADSYDAHMHQSLEESKAYYQTLSQSIGYREHPLDILDIGCRTGLEIPAILAAAPNARLTCIDLSIEMLKKLKS